MTNLPIVLVTGSKGMLGTVLKEMVQDKQETMTFNFIDRENLNLSDYHAVKNMFFKVKPSYVIHLASDFRGFYHRIQNQADVLINNFKINQNISKACVQFQVKKCIMCFSAAAFPCTSDDPMSESALETAPPHYKDIGYAHSARTSIALNKCYRDAGCIVEFIHVFFCSLYGPHDNFNLVSGHVLPAFIQKASLSASKKITFCILGTGKPFNKYLDAASLLLKVLEEYNDDEPIILSVDPSEEISIRELAQKVKIYSNFKKEIINDTTLDDGPHKRTLDNSKMKSLWPDFKFTPLDDGLNILTKGIKKTVKWFSQNHPNLKK